MERQSDRFVTAMRRLLDTGRPVVATVAARGGGFIQGVKARADVEVWDVTVENRGVMVDRVLGWLRAQSPSKNH